MSIVKTGKLLLLTCAVALGLGACGGGGDDGGGVITQAWYDVYGHHCGTLGPGCNFYSDGTQIVDYQDPYYNPSLYPQIYDTYYYYDSYGHFQGYTGWVSTSPTGILYDEWGYALNSKEKHGKDVITNAAAAQKTAINGAAQVLSAKYGLDANVSKGIAVALNDWALIGKSRKRTQKDVEAFTKRLTGLKVSEINAALEAAKNGDTAAADQAIEKAADNWSTSPDTMKQIMKDWFAKQQ